MWENWQHVLRFLLIARRLNSSLGCKAQDIHVSGELIKNNLVEVPEGHCSAVFPPLADKVKRAMSVCETADIAE